MMSGTIDLIFHIKSMVLHVRWVLCMCVILWLQAVFKRTKDAFTSLPVWKQATLKKQVGLF